MKKTKFAVMAVIMAAAVALTVGCAKNDEVNDTAAADNTAVASVTDTAADAAPVSVTDTAAVTAFKTGTWACAEGVNYVFYEDGESGRNVNVADKMGVGFSYELSADGKCVFHMGSADDNTNATVEFIMGGDDTASITWENGDKTVLYFVKEDTSDDFADNYVMGEITGEDE